jgi:hypothetical protein
LLVQRLKVATPTTGLALRKAGSLSRGLNITHKKLKESRMESKDNDHSNEIRYMIKELTVAAWNVRGITHKVDKLVTVQLQLVPIAPTGA